MPVRLRLPTAAVALVVAAISVVCLTTALGRGGGDGGRGRQVFAKHCAVCHAVTAGVNMEGPSLHRIVGRKAGTVPFYSGYRALKDSEAVWTDATLDAWLADPRGFAGGRDNKMNVRLDSADDRADVIAYLKSLR